MARKGANSSDGVSDIIMAPFSSDRTTRRMGTLFFFSVLGLIVTLIWGLPKLAKKDRPEPAVASSELEMSSSLKNQTAEDHIESAKAVTDEAELLAQLGGPKIDYPKYSLGRFTIQIKYSANEKFATARNASLAQVEVTVECDIKRTCDYIKHNEVRAKDRIVHSLTIQTRDSMSTPEGKQKVKDAMMEGLNKWLPSGKVRNVYFTHLITS